LLSLDLSIIPYIVQALSEYIYTHAVVINYSLSDWFFRIVFDESTADTFLSEFWTRVSSEINGKQQMLSTTLQSIDTHDAYGIFWFGFFHPRR
jgi:hypothetical protein